MHAGGGGGIRSRRASSRDILAAVALSLVVAVFFRGIFQTRMLSDGAGLATFFARGELLTYHFLFLPACRLVAPLAILVPGEDPIEAPRLLSAVAAGIGCGFTWLLARALGAPRFGAAIGTLLATAAPAVVFFGTTVEVHSLHFATVAGGAWVTLSLPWGRLGVALPVAAALFGLLFWAHQISILLGPGWIALCQLGRARIGRPLATRTLLVGIGPVFLAAAAVASALAAALRHGTAFPSAGEELRILREFVRPDGAWRFAWDGWLLPLAVLVPAACLGIARGDLEPGARRALLLCIVFPLVFLVAWGVAEYGGYALGHAPFLACFAALAFPRATPRAITIAVLLFLTQAVLAAQKVHAFDRRWDPDERIELAREHLQGGVFVATVNNAPQLEVYFPATEVLLWEGVDRANRDGFSTLQIIELMKLQAHEHVQGFGRVLFDLAFETQDFPGAGPMMRPFAEPLARALEAEFKTTRIEHPDWPMLIVEPR